MTIRFRAEVGGVEFACGREYSGLGSANTTVTPQDLRLFVQDLALLRSDGTSVPVALTVRAPWQSDRVALLDFEDSTGRCVEGNPEMNSEIVGTVPEGTYTGLSFSNGVPPAINHADPATQPAPVGTYAALSWGWLTGFRFIKAELVQVTPAGEPFGLGLVHPGSTACTGNPQQNTVTCARSNRTQIRFEDFDPATNVVVIDVAAVFASTNLTELAECHSSGSYCESMFSALGIDYATGMPKSSQTVFSVE